MYKYALLLLLPLFLNADVKEIPNQTKLKILSPEFSRMETKRVVLENGLQAYLVSDPQLKQSGAALVVNVGSWDEPLDHPGLAHFLEHMLFMGTKKYPSEGEYSSFLTEHGGTFNAYTADDITSYMFVINHDYFQGALDRFSQFFKEPLFNASGVSRELKAINQEYSKNVEDDDFREYYILKSLGDPNHPFSHFDMGNIESLKNSSRDDLIAWYGTHYSSDLMYLIAFSSMPMDKLTTLIENEFQSVPRKNHPLQADRKNSIPDSLKGKLLKIRPIKNSPSISITWELPGKFLKMRDTHPQTLVATVLGDEGPGSLLALLKEKHLAEGLRAGTMTLGGSSLILSLDIELTKQGAEDPNRVLELLFQEIALLKKDGIPDYVFEDVQHLQKIKYQLRSRSNLFNELETLTSIIKEEDLSTFPEKSYVIQSNDPAAVNEIIDSLTPSNAVYTWKIPNYQNANMQKEKWLGGEFTMESLPENLLNAWADIGLNPQLHLPQKNVFIPNKLTVREVQPADFPTPVKVYDTEFGQVYYTEDPLYKVPKVSIEFVLHTPKITLKNARSIVLADYYVAAATELLNEISYPASQAGLSFRIFRDDDTIRLSLDGFNDKAVPFLLTVVEALQTLSITEERFQEIQSTLERGYQNSLKESPIKQAYEIFKSSVYKNYPTDIQKYAASQKILPKHFKLFTKHLFNRIYVEGMIFGNITKKETIEMTEKIISSLGKDPYPVANQTKPEVISLLSQEEPLNIARKINVDGNAAILAIDFGTLTPKSRAVQQITDLAMSDPFFTELRTKQQTGYIVFSAAEEAEKNLFNIFAVQSTSHSARDLLARYELFIENFLMNFNEELPHERFENIKNSIIIQLQQGPKSYSEMGDLLEKLAFDYDDDFDWVKKRIQALQDLTYEEFSKEVNASLGKSNKGRLAITVTGYQNDANLINYRTVRNLRAKPSVAQTEKKI